MTNRDTPLSSPRLSNSRGRYEALDLWRGVAALLIVVFHSTSQYRSAPEQDSFVSQVGVWCLQYMWLGVPLFFVISGYCIAATIDNVRRKPTPVRTYMTKRFRRIYPPYAIWLTILLVALLGMEFAAPNSKIWQNKGFVLYPTSMSAMDWLSNYTLTFTWLPRLFGFQSLNLTRVGWSLCYEIQFYLICGLLLAVASKRFFSGAALFSIAVGLLFAFQPALNLPMNVYGTILDVRWLEFAFGLWLYYCMTYATTRGKWLFACGLPLIALVAAANIRPFPGGWLGTRNARLLEIAVSGSFAVLLFWLKKYDAQMAQSKWSRHLMLCGVFSYSLYLVHWPFCKVLGLVTWRMGLRSFAATMMVTVPLCVAVSIVAGLLYYRLVERRWMNVASTSVVPTKATLPLEEAATQSA